MAKREKIETLEEFHDELRAGIMIDKDDLDHMWIEQPQLYQKLGERLAIEISHRDAAKEELKDLEAELDGAIREEDAERIDRDGGKKMTETAIKNQIRDDKEFKRMSARVAQMNLDVARLGVLKESYQMRRYALQDLTSLHISGYSMSSGSKPSSERVADKARKDMQALRKKREEED
jgi:uncharacterized protein (DUF3084 family)